MITFEWNQQNNHHFDLYENIFRRVNDFHRWISMIRIDFMNTKIMFKDESFNHNELHKFIEIIAKNASSCFVIDDFFSHSCIRLKHNKMMFSSKKVSNNHFYVKSTKNKYFRFWITNQLLNQYQIDENEILNEIEKFFFEVQQITMRNENTIIKNSRYTCLLKNVLQKNVVDVLITNESKI